MFLSTYFKLSVLLVSPVIVTPIIINVALNLGSFLA